MSRYRRWRLTRGREKCWQGKHRTRYYGPANHAWIAHPCTRPCCTYVRWDNLLWMPL